MNVMSADATVLFGNMSSAGSKMTINFLLSNDKHYICNPTVEQLIRFIRDHKVATLNVAGNRSSKLSNKQKQEIATVLFNTLKYLQNGSNESSSE